MAAPTEVRVESNSITTAVIRWIYGGAAAVGVYRSTDGITYSLVASTTPAALTYTDTGLSTATKYWYKLSDDGGATFSSVVTVVTQSCADPANQGFVLPRFDGGQQPSVQLNDLAREVEATLNQKVLEPSECEVCPADGAVVLDCRQCHDVSITVDQDINSISMFGCEGSNFGDLKFIIPPNVTRRICGFPAGTGMTGDECSQAPIAGGAEGRTVTVGLSGGKINAGKTRSQSGYGKPGGGGGSGCTCVPGAQGQLTIKSCNANNSLNCGSTKSLALIACGGRAPYTWSKTGGVVLSRTTEDRITVTPPTNAGSGVAGTAYVKRCYRCTSCVAGACATVATFKTVGYGCNDAVVCCDTCGSVCSTTPPALGAVTCSAGGGIAPCLPNNTDSPCPGDSGCDGCPSVSCDNRSGAMIAAGCNPCGLQEGSTVSVTDAVGTVTTIILKA